MILIIAFCCLKGDFNALIGMKMEQMNFLPHTAEIRMHVEADSDVELFRASLRGMAKVLFPQACDLKHAMVGKPIHVESSDKPALLIDFLSQVLMISHTENVLFCRMVCEYLGVHYLDGVVYGYPIHQFNNHIKSINYLDSDVMHNSPDKWETTLVFNI